MGRHLATARVVSKAVQFTQEPTWRITFNDDSFRISMSEQDVRITEIGMSVIEWDQRIHRFRTTLYPWHAVKAVVHTTKEHEGHAW